MRGGRAAESDDDEEMVLIFGNDGLVFLSARVLAHSIVRCGVVEHTCVRFGCASGVVHRTSIHKHLQHHCAQVEDHQRHSGLKRRRKDAERRPQGPPLGTCSQKGTGHFSQVRDAVADATVCISTN